MPTTRRRRTREHNGAITMDKLDFGQLLQLGGEGWSPRISNEPKQNFVKWVTWKDFMATWVAVRDEFLSHEQWGRPPVFAEQIYNAYGIKGPPDDATYEEIRTAIAAAEDRDIEELLADVKLD